MIGGGLTFIFQRRAKFSGVFTKALKKKSSAQGDGRTRQLLPAGTNLAATIWLELRRRWGI